MMNDTPEGKVPPEKALEIIGELMKALDYAHFRGIYHRDIKPDNIMFRQDHTPVLVDFGIARVFDSPDQLTRSGMSLGTVYYMSPEQCLAQKDIDGRSDIYSLGVVLFEMLSGQKPYDGDSQMYIAFQHIQKPVPNLPPEFEYVQPLIDNMMDKEKKKRIKDRAEYLKLVERVLAVDEPTVPDTRTEVPNPTPSPILTASTLETEAFPSRPKVEPRPLNFRIKPSGGPFSRLTDIFKSWWGPFGDFMKDRLGPALARLLERIDPIMSKPITKKLLLVFLPAVVVLLLITLFIFKPGYKTQTQPVGTNLTENQIALLFHPDKFFKEIFEYPQVYNLYQNGDPESLRQALKIIEGWKILSTTPEVEAMAGKIEESIELEDEFYRHFNAAQEYFMQKNLKRAKEFILKAKQIKITEALLELEMRIDEKLKLFGKD
jgi:serine/threonine protein kinase